MSIKRDDAEAAFFTTWVLYTNSCCPIFCTDHLTFKKKFLKFCWKCLKKQWNAAEIFIFSESLKYSMKLEGGGSIPIAITTCTIMLKNRQLCQSIKYLLYILSVNCGLKNISMVFYSLSLKVLVRNICLRRRKVIGTKSSLAKQLFRRSGKFPAYEYCVV